MYAPALCYQNNLAEKNSATYYICIVRGLSTVLPHEIIPVPVNPCCGCSRLHRMHVIRPAGIKDATCDRDLGDKASSYSISLGLIDI